MFLIPEWVIGVSFQLMASLFSNLGINIQKYAHTKHQRLPPSHPAKFAPYYKLPTWIMGFVCFCFGECLAGVAMGYASQSLLAVLSSYSLILNVIFSYWLTGAKSSQNYLSACFIIMLGSIIVILSSSHHKQHYTLEDLGKLLRSGPFLVFLSFVLFLLLGLFLVRSVIPKNATLLTSISSLMACLSVLLAKCFMQLVKTSFLTPIYNGEDLFYDNQFLQSFYPYLIMLLFATFASLNVHFMNLALQQSSTNEVYPLYYTFSTILIILNGMLFFQEYMWFTTTQMITFSFGVATCLVGISHLQDQRNRYDEYDNISQFDDDSSLIFNKRMGQHYLSPTTHEYSEDSLGTSNSNQDISYQYDHRNDSYTVNHPHLALELQDPKMSLSYTTLLKNPQKSQNHGHGGMVRLPLTNKHRDLQQGSQRGHCVSLVRAQASPHLTNFFDAHQPQQEDK